MRALFAYAAALALSGPSMVSSTNTAVTVGTPATVHWDALVHLRRRLERDLAQSVDRLLDDGAYRSRINETGHDDPTALSAHYGDDDDDDDAFEGTCKRGRGDGKRTVRRKPTKYRETPECQKVSFMLRKSGQRREKKIRSDTMCGNESAHRCDFIAANSN